MMEEESGDPAVISATTAEESGVPSVSASSTTAVPSAEQNGQKVVEEETALDGDSANSEEPADEDQDASTSTHTDEEEEEDVEVDEVDGPPDNDLIQQLEEGFSNQGKLVCNCCLREGFVHFVACR